jgi:RimJ/RimL family protein N-acetyltransferase
MPESPDDLALLRIEAETLWGAQSVGRLPQPHAAIIASAGGHAVVIADAVPADLGSALRDVVSDTTPRTDPAQVPVVYENCRALLEERLGPVRCTSGPSYLIPADVSFPASATIIDSAEHSADWLRNGNPGNWPEPEWQQLIAGELGPWAMAVTGEAVVAICHTPVRSPRGAEAGVWTHPEHRGQGHAAAVTAAWARLIRPSGRQLFDSTWKENHSSQRVAARLRLRPIGWMWKIAPP